MKNNTFGNALKKRREELGLSFFQAAGLCDICPYTYKKWESGERRPNVNHARKIETAFGKDVCNLATFYGVTTPDFVAWVKGLYKTGEITQRSIAEYLETSVQQVFRALYWYKDIPAKEDIPVEVIKMLKGNRHAERHLRDKQKKLEAQSYAGGQHDNSR